MADAKRHLSLQVGLTLHNVYRVAVADRLVGLYNTPPKLRAVWLIISLYPPIVWIDSTFPSLQSFL